MIEPNTRLASDQARIQINTVQPCVHADGTPYVMAQFYAEPGPCPERCPRGCEPVEVVEREEPNPEYADWQARRDRAANVGLPFDEAPPPETVTIGIKEQKWTTPEGAQWPRCATCGADCNPAVDSPARTPDVVKDALYVPSEIGTDELAKLILTKADARRAESARVAVDTKSGLILLNLSASVFPTHGIEIKERTPALLADGSACEAVSIVIHEAGLPGQVPPPVELTVLVPTDRPLADAVREAGARALKETPG